MIRRKKDSGELGGIAIEYVIVTSFALVLGIAMLAVTTNMIQGRLETIATKLGIEIDTDFLNAFRVD
jgi:hypothetical protein